METIVKQSQDKRKSNPGRKSIGDERKKPITFYRPGTQIEKLGGIEVVRKAMAEIFDAKIKSL